MKITDLEKKVEIIELYDEYSKMLTQTQRKYFELYYFDDLSLGEISQLHNVSRNAVYDQMRRGVKKLTDLENILFNIKYKKTVRKIIEVVKDQEKIKVLIKELEDME